MPFELDFYFDDEGVWRHAPSRRMNTLEETSEVVGKFVNVMVTEAKYSMSIRIRSVK